MGVIFSEDGGCGVGVRALGKMDKKKTRENVEKLAKIRKNSKKFRKTHAF